jgi:hypothetical protein
MVGRAKQQAMIEQATIATDTKTFRATVPSIAANVAH